MISLARPYARIDMVLIGLAMAFDFDAASALYEERWGSRAPGLKVVSGCVHDVEYRPATRCRVTHELTLQRPGHERWRTFGVVDVHPGGFGVRSFDEDPELPWLADTMIPETVGAHLRDRGLGSVSRVFRAVPVRYKPGSRCVVRLDTEAGAVFAKVMAETDVERLAKMARGLREVPCLLQPLGYSSELHMLVLPAVTGNTELHRLAFDTIVPTEQRLLWIRKAGRALATLHDARVQPGPARLLTDDARALRQLKAPLAAAAPALLPSFVDAVRRLACLHLEEGPPVASHGAFRTDQLLVERGEPVIIDLDSLCWANPARDIGNFNASLRWKAIREPQHAAFVDAAVSSFLAGYETVRPIPDERWTARYQAASMLKLAGRRFRKLNVSEWPLVPRLLDGAHTLIRRSERTTTRRGSADTITGFFRAALDPGTMSARFRPLLATIGTGTQPPAVARVELVCEKPEHRWTFLYTLEGGQQEVVGKVYREAARGQRAFETMRWLWEHDGGVPQPLGWITELSMLTYLPVSGRLLGDTIFDERAATDMERTADWLAALHGSPLPLDRSFDVPNELKNLREWSSVVGSRHPDQAHAAERISAQLAQIPSRLGAAPSRPIHKDFHLQHVFVADRARVIDLDEVRLGDPTFDVAHFCAYLRLLGLRAPDRAASLDRRRDEFLAAYRRRSECDLSGRFDAFYAYTCLKIAKQLCTLRGLEPRPQAEEEHRQTAAILREGLAALDCT